MKNFLAISILLAITFISCDKGKTTEETSTETAPMNKVENFSVDSLKVNDSLEIDKNLSVSFKSKVLFFHTVKDKALLDSIFAPEKIHLEEYSRENLTAVLNQKKKEFYDEQKEGLKDWKPDFKQNWNRNSDMNVFSNENDFMTIQYTSDSYTGGAHGYYYETYKVFDLKNKKTVQLTDVATDIDSKIWDKILMDNFLQNDSENGQAEMLLVKEIPLNNNFYFDKEYLYFLYNQYEITAYAAGPVLIKIPFSDIKPFLTAEFIKRQGL